MANTSRMTSYQRREQLIEIGRSLFASKGFEAVSVEEIAATAKVSKPIVYEHFGGKEGLYAVVVDREMRALTDTLVNALSDPQAHPRQIVERTALALLTYVEENAEGFRVLTRDSPKTDPASSFNSLLGDIALRVEDILAEAFKRQHLPAKGVPYYAQMLIGMTVYTCQYWADQRKLSKEQIAGVASEVIRRYRQDASEQDCAELTEAFLVLAGIWTIFIPESFLSDWIVLNPSFSI